MHEDTESVSEDLQTSVKKLKASKREVWDGAKSIGSASLQSGN
jgi:hypothetical protein